MVLLGLPRQELQSIGLAVDGVVWLQRTVGRGAGGYADDRV